MASQLNSLLMVRYFLQQLLMSFEDFTFAQNLTGLENASVALSRIHEIATLPAESDPAQASDKNPSPDSPVSKGSVEFQNLSLQYG
jgi:ABC-type multidrug transport system fused ATPase/permease subunit